MAASNEALIPEIVETPVEALRLVACPHPFSTTRIDLTLPAGGTLADLMRVAGLNPDGLYARVFVDDVLFDRVWWPYVTPDPGQFVTVRVIPTGGGGGGGGKDALRIVMMIAVVAIAIVAPYALAGSLGLGTGFLAAVGGPITGLAGVLIGAGLGIVGSLAINGLIPAPAPRRAELTEGHAHA
jgi:hypothetical protein